MNTLEQSQAYAAALWRFYRREDHDEPAPPESLSWSQSEAIARHVYFEFTRAQLTRTAKQLLQRTPGGPV